MEETIWAASGGQIFIISTETHSVEVNASVTLLAYFTMEPHFKIMVDKI